MIPRLQRICSSSGWWKIGVVILILFLFLFLQFLDFRSAKISPDSIRFTCQGGPNNVGAFVTMAGTTMALVPGELPGYTGWARPEGTLAGHFSIVSFSNQQPRTGQEFSVTVQCTGHEECAKGTSMFFLRAYGPSVVPGIFVNEGNGLYKMIFIPMDPGLYTVEVVLTFSDTPAFETLPLPSTEQETPYEGYLLPGFPLQLAVQEPSTSYETTKQTNTLCTLDDLIESSSSSAVSKGRWKVRTKMNEPGYTSSSIGNKQTSEDGYIKALNSLGIQMSYDYASNCTLVSRAAYRKQQQSNHPFAQCGQHSNPPKNLQVIFIGDSVMRIQKDVFDGMVKHLPNIKTSYLSLYGGYRRCQKLKTDVRVYLNDIQRRFPNDLKAILFNTGLHDIHRLCGKEWNNDRYEYLDKEILDSGRFFCVNEYRSLMDDFAKIIQDFKADLNVFQTSTAAWPKYGNWGIEWSFGSQHLPLASDVVSHFNDIAFDVLEKYRESIQIMDGYWITYSRPDNREVGDIGHKLSHPGLEVQTVMMRIWSMILLAKACN